MKAEGVYVRVHVTTEDIQMGQRGLGARCPIALASSRALGHETFVDGWRIACMDTAQLFESPEWVAKWIVAYDCDGPAAVEPVAFEARLV